MLLASVKGIRDQLGFDDMQDINLAITGGLHAAETIISSLLNTSFRRGEATDIYYVERPNISKGHHRETQFRFSFGMVKEVKSFGTGFTLDTITTAPGSVIDEVGFRLDADRGLLSDFATPYRGQFVAISYVYGFDAAKDDEDSYDLDQVPVWLQEAAKLKAQINFAKSPAITEASIELDTNVIDAQFQALLSGKLRYAPLSLLPM